MRTCPWKIERNSACGAFAFSAMATNSAITSEMRAELSSEFLDKVGIVLGEDEERVAWMLRSLEIEASRDHHAAFEIRVVGRIVERRARAHRVTDHDDPGSIDEARLAQELD